MFYICGFQIGFVDPVKISCSSGNSYLVCINILEDWPDNLLSVAAFSEPSEAAVDPQESGNSGQILL